MRRRTGTRKYTFDIDDVADMLTLIASLEQKDFTTLETQALIVKAKAVVAAVESGQNIRLRVQGTV